jgi:hypothetical protein
MNESLLSNILWKFFYQYRHGNTLLFVAVMLVGFVCAIPTQDEVDFLLVLITYSINNQSIDMLIQSYTLSCYPQSTDELPCKKNAMDTVWRFLGLIPDSTQKL